jgi:hypothetical protein
MVNNFHMNDLRRWMALAEAFQYEMFPPNSLYHTTSPGAAFEILQAGELRPISDGFVSLSEKPHLHDIQAHGAAIIFDLRKLYAQLEPVQYTEAWAQTHPDHARYIAGEGWSEQFEYQSDGDGDADDDDHYEEEYAAAEMTAFLDKASEDEWISLHPGTPVRFQPHAVTGLILDHLDDETRAELAKIGYAHVQLRQA